MGSKVKTAVAVALPSTQAFHLELRHGDGGQKSAFARKFLLQHPEWLLDKNEDVDWSKHCGTVLDASYSALANIGPIARAVPTFTRLTVLCLRESGVVDIELLEQCHSLVHLDLSSNEIVHLVGGDFWASFPDMLVLLLHGNKVMEWRAVGGLGRAPKLAYLTLFFNPICKRRMYRPFTTNCCESLRGLDLHAVSDEEVVEGFQFLKTSRYSTCSNALAIPQPLFKGLTEVTLGTIQQEEPSDNMTPSTAAVLVGKDSHLLRSAPNRDVFVLATVLSCVRLLRTFHARNSPVIIGQRQIRRFLGERFGVAAAVKIQARVRRWIVKMRAVAALKGILRASGELYLVQEMMTPIQLRSLAWFQRRIAGHLRLKVLITCTKTLERFMGKVAKKFSACVDSLERAQVGGVVVAHSQSGELAAAVAKALIVTTPGLTWVEAAERTATMVTTVYNCKLLRPFSYVEMSDWPVLERDADTDGVFVSRSAASVGPCADLSRIGSNMPDVTKAFSMQRPLSGLRELRPRSHVRNRAGVFGSPRVKEFKVSRRNCAVRKFCQGSAAAKERAMLNSRSDVNKQLWAFRPLKVRMLARVLCTLRNGSMGKPPVPFILERQLLRCASATRIQAAWRGHVLRWTLLDTLASCVIVARAGVCIQRWWRYRRGLASRLGLCRRLWALASAVSSPTMYIELDVFYALARGWHWASDEESVAFTFQSKDRAAMMPSVSGPPSDDLRSEEASHRTGQEERRFLAIHDRATSDAKKRLGRELPLWMLKSVFRNVFPSNIHHRPVLTKVGALLTVDTKAKKVVWPLMPVNTGTAEPPEDSGARDVANALRQSDRNLETSSESSSTGICLTSVRNEEVGGQTHPARRSQQLEGSAEAGPPISLGTKNGDEVELLELTFSSTQEARARAVLLALATEEPGVWPNRPVAQLMTLGMLRRAAAGEPGQALPIPEAPAQGFRRGDAVEVSVFRLTEGRGGAWFPAIVDRRNGYTYQVTLETGLVEHNVPDGRIRPQDCTGKETALVEMSHIPSRWQTDARSRTTPADRLELELLRRSLPMTASAKPSLGERLGEVLTGNPGKEVNACISVEELRQFNGLCGRGLIPVGPRPISSESPVGRADARTTGPSPPRWAGSQTMSAARTAGGLAAGALQKVAKAAAAADAAATASTWVPGNRFRVGLEKLVHMAAHQAQDAAGKVELSARRDTVSRARHAERAEPSPRYRVERSKAAEVAVFRRESDEINDRAALEKAMHGHELKANAAEARGHTRDCKRLAAEAMEAKLAIHKSIVKQRESESEDERRRNLNKRNADLDAAKERAAHWRKCREKQGLCLAESNAFTANASQLSRHVCKHTALSYKAQNARGIRRWVKGKKIHKDDMRRRMLKRVQELQEQKRSEGGRLRRTLAARSRARVAMDEAVVRHRVGQTISSAGILAQDVMHVLRPSSRLQGTESEQVGGVHEDEDSRSGAVHLEDRCRVPQRPADTSNFREPRRPDNICHVDGSTSARGEIVPSKPKAARPRSQSLRASETGKTVVVLASVPTVTREARSVRPLQGTRGAALLGSTSSHSMISPSRDGATPNVQLNQTHLPWPLGPRCW